jgi:hypothetical protein
VWIGDKDTFGDVTNISRNLWSLLIGRRFSIEPVSPISLPSLTEIPSMDEGPLEMSRERRRLAPATPVTRCRRRAWMAVFGDGGFVVMRCLTGIAKSFSVKVAWSDGSSTTVAPICCPWQSQISAFEAGYEQLLDSVVRRLSMGMGIMEGTSLIYPCMVSVPLATLPCTPAPAKTRSHRLLTALITEPASSLPKGILASLLIQDQERQGRSVPGRAVPP